MWRLMLNKLPTKDNLKIRNVIVDVEDCKCSFCDCVEEPVNHCFL